MRISFFVVLSIISKLFYGLIVGFIFNSVNLFRFKRNYRYIYNRYSAKGKRMRKRVRETDTVT